MIKFEELVESFLIEQEPVATTQAAAIATDPTFSYFTSPKGQGPYDEFAKAFQTAYGKLPLSNTQELQRLITALEGSSNKNELTISNFTEYTESFPLIDFILYVAQTSLGQSKANIGQFKAQIQNDKIKKAADNAAKSYIKTFSNTMKNRQYSWPLDYPSLTGQARMLEVGLRKKLADNVVGTLALENLSTKSIYDTVITLLANRKKIRDPRNTVGPSDKFINDILYGDYKKYAGGGEMVKGKYARMWDQYSVEKLIELGQSIRNFYNYQKALFVPKQDPSQQPPVPVPTLEQFVKNNIKGQRFSWTAPEASSTQPLAPSNASFDQSFELLYNDLLNEKNSAVTRTLYGSSAVGAGNFGANLAGTSSFSEPQQPTPTQSTSSVPANPEDNEQTESEDKQTPELPKEGYDIKHIMSLTEDSAKDLINKLKQLGDYIAEKEPPDWLGKISGALSGATQIAKGLSLGVPTMGR